MVLQIIGLFLLFTYTGASFGSGHLDFMSGAKKESLLHAKDPGVEVEDFSDSFRDVASSPDKVKATFRILNRPNDSRFKLDLALIVSKIFILEDETQPLKHKKHAWSVLYPLLVKYDQNFTYPADYDIESGDYIEITVDEWIDRYTQDKAAVKSSKKDDDEQLGSGHLEVFESGDREMKSLMDGSGSFDEYLRSLEQQIDMLHTQEGSGSVDEHPVSEEDGVSIGFLPDQATTTEESAEQAALREAEEEASVEEVELYRESREGEDFEEMQVNHLVDGDDLMLQHRVGYAVEVHPQEFGKEPIQVGSIRGIPGVHFPDYEEIPITSFSCADKKYVPGFYADLETGCQVFHVCWPHRRESFLCPIGTLFNQAILACDYWYSTNCSLSRYYDDVNDRIYQRTTLLPPTHEPSPTKPSHHPKQPTRATPSCHPEQPATPSPSLADVDWSRVISILPIKSKVYVYPPHQVMKSSKKTVPTKHQLPTSVEDKVLKEAIVSKIVSKVLHAAELIAKSARPPVSQIPFIQTPKKQKGIPKINPKFVVRSSDKLDDMKAILASKGVARQVKKTKVAKERIPDIVLGAMEMAGTVLQKDILALTRLALVEGSLKHSKSIKH